MDAWNGSTYSRWLVWESDEASSSQSLWTTDIIDPLLHVKQILYIHTLLSIPTLQLREESLRDPVTSQITGTCVSCTWQNTWRLVAYADRDLPVLQKNSACGWLLGSLQQLDSLSTGFCSLCHGAVMLWLSQQPLCVPERKGVGRDSHALSLLSCKQKLFEKPLLDFSLPSLVRPV